MYHLQNRSVSFRAQIAMPILALVVAIGFVASLAAAADPSPADSDTALIADDLDSTPIGSRIPLLLIHGIHGNRWFDETDTVSNPGDENYWSNFRQYFYSANNVRALKDKYKLFRFRYISDKHSVQEIARSLRNLIDADSTNTGIGAFPKRPFVIVAHSMGGLVARSYMNEIHYAQAYQHTFGGDHVLRLITLATLHHGTPLASGYVRSVLATTGEWDALFGIVTAYLRIFKQSEVGPFASNRADLKWNNFDHRVTDVQYNLDNNILLDALHEYSTYDGKIIAYTGYIVIGDPARAAVRDMIGLVPNSVLASIAISSYLDSAVTPTDREHRECLVGSVLLGEGLNGVYAVNDGAVPWDSARFTGQNVVRREFIGYDHADMRDGKQVGNSNPLFDQVSTDLLSVAPTSLTKDVPVNDNTANGYRYYYLQVPSGGDLCVHQDDGYV